jgi:hypothetical protein
MRSGVTGISRCFHAVIAERITIALTTTASAGVVPLAAAHSERWVGEGTCDCSQARNGRASARGICNP